MVNIVLIIIINIIIMIIITIIMNLIIIGMNNDYQYHYCDHCHDHYDHHENCPDHHHLKTMSERYFPVPIAGKNVRNWSDVTPPLVIIFILSITVIVTKVITICLINDQ